MRNNHLQLFFALIAAVMLMVGVMAAYPVSAEPTGETWDTSCGQTIEAFDPEDHIILVPQANGTVSCWLSGGKKMWEIRQREMAVVDNAKPAYGIFFPIPQAEVCRWWGVQATLTDSEGNTIMPRYSAEAAEFYPTKRLAATAEDPYGDSAAGFLIVCEGVTSDVLSTPTPTPVTPEPTQEPTPQPTAEPTAEPTTEPLPTPDPVRVCEQPLVAFAVDNNGKMSTKVMSEAYKPKTDLTLDSTIVIGQWQIAGQPSTPHWFCLLLPPGTWEVTNSSGAIENKHEVQILNGSGQLTLTEPTWLWVWTWNGTQLSGPAWHNYVPVAHR